MTTNPDDLIFWDQPSKEWVKQGGWSTEKIAELPEEPWAFKGDCGTSCIYVFREEHGWTFTTESMYGKDPEVVKHNKVFESLEAAKLAAIDECRVTCEVCKEDCTFDGFITSFAMGKGEDKVEITGIECRPCDMARRVRVYTDTGRIDNRLGMEAHLATYRMSEKPKDEWPDNADAYLKIVAVYENMNKAVKRFEEVVWFGGLQEFVHNCKWKGALATFGDGVKFLSYTMCARSRVTLEHPEGFFIDVITAEDGSDRVMGINGIGCTEHQGIALLNHAADAWAAGEIDIQPDTGVGILL